jgi:hypothetical protein
LVFGFAFAALEDLVEGHLELLLELLKDVVLFASFEQFFEVLGIIFDSPGHQEFHSLFPLVVSAVIGGMWVDFLSFVSSKSTIFVLLIYFIL